MLNLEEYKKSIIKRYDYEPYLKYFSYKDFKGLKYDECNIKVNIDVINGGFYYYNKETTNNLIVFVHGIGPGHLCYMKEIEILASKGFKVFAYDMIDTGKSTGVQIKGLSGAVESLDYVLDYLHAKYKNITLVGHSLGAFASLNIVKYKPYIKNVVAISGFLAIDLLEAMTLEPEKIIAYEKELNGYYYQNIDEVLNSLECYKGNIMVIHSKDDQTVNPKTGIDFLKKHLVKKIKYLMVDGKGHNPNYIKEAVSYMNKIFSDFNKKLKEMNMSLDDKIKYFKNVDFDKMTKQDVDVWNEIFKFIKH